MDGVTRPARVLFTVTFGERSGGAEGFLWTFLRHVDRARIEPSAVFFQAGPFEREVAALGIPTRVVETGRFRQLGRLFASVGELRGILRAERPDLVLNWFTRAQLYGSVAATAAGMRDRVSWWQHLATQGDALDRAATLLPARAIGTSSPLAADAQRQLRPRRPVFTVEPGIDRPELPDPAALDRLRERLGIPAGVPVVGTVGRLQPLKAQDVALRALARLRDAGIAVHGLVVGGSAHGLDRDYAGRLRDLARELDLTGRVTFTGQVPDAAAHVALMDVLVNTCPREAFGIALVEAMALGVPVVAVDSPGPRQITDGGRAGVLVPAGDEPSLAAAVRRLLGDEPARAALARAGLERYEERFTAERMTAALEDRLVALAGLQRASSR